MKNEKFKFNFAKWNGSKVQLIVACKDYIASGKKHNGAKMRVVNGCYCVRNWDRFLHRWSWTPIVSTAAKAIAEKRGNLGGY